MNSINLEPVESEAERPDLTALLAGRDLGLSDVSREKKARLKAPPRYFEAGMSR